MPLQLMLHIMHILCLQSCLHVRMHLKWNVHFGPVTVLLYNTWTWHVVSQSQMSALLNKATSCVAC